MRKFKFVNLFVLGILVLLVAGCESRSFIPAQKAPIASAGIDVEITTGTTVSLDASNSTDINNDPLTYTWSIIGSPVGSTATIANETSVNAFCTTDVDGDYTIQLIVNDGTFDSDPITIVITSQNPAASNNPGGEGDIAFVLLWAHSGSSHGEGPDIDLWVINPNGNRLSSSRDGYGLGPDPDGGIIDFDDLGGMGDGDGGGPERAYWPTNQSPPGTYTYGVRYYGGDGTVEYTLYIYKGQTLVSAETGFLYSFGADVQVGTILN